MRTHQHFFKESLIFSGAILPFIILLYKKYLFLDFWYDELLTFDHFVLVPLQKTLTDYSIPNNHIFFNLLNNLYLRLSGVGELFDLMDAPVRIRLLMLVYTLGTLVVVFLLGKKFFNRFLAQSSVLILVTSIPFVNFAVQVRGYMLGILLLTSLLYVIWSFERCMKSRYLAGTFVLVVLALYTNPSNLYFVGSVTVFYLVDGLVWMFRKMRVDSSSFGMNALHDPSLIVASALSAGAFAAFCMYLPFLESIVGNRHYKSHGMFHLETLSKTLPKTLLFFISQRYALVTLAVLGLIVAGVSSLHRKRRGRNRYARKIVLMLSVLFFPFVLSYIRGDYPFYRVFLNLTPVFAICVAFGIDTLRRLWLKRVKTSSPYLALGLFLYCYATFAQAFHHKDLQIIREHEQEQKSQNIYTNYYQADYHPTRLSQNLQRDMQEKLRPVNLIPNVESYEIRRYLEKFHIPYNMDPSEFLVNSEGEAYFVTPFTKSCIHELTKIVPDVRCELRYRPQGFHKVLVCRFPLNGAS